LAQDATVSLAASAATATAMRCVGKVCDAAAGPFRAPPISAVKILH
jgi:hypothetical protein